MATSAADLDARDCFGRSALQQAVRETTGMYRLQRLIEDGCDINAQDWFGKTALQSALELQDTDTCAYLVEKMVEQGKRLPVKLPRAVSSWASKKRWFPALESVVSGHDSSTSLTQGGYLALLGFLTESLKLPETIVARILDDAEFWVTAAVRRKDKISVDEHCPVEPYITVVNPALQGYVRRIDVLTVSHDQGWCQQGLPGSYVGSFTWFDLAAIRGQEKAQVLELQSNICASRSGRTHYNEMRLRAPAIADWMNALKPGDRIAVYPRARYGAWVNYVEHVEIKLWYALWHV
ncbi:uncharacterized protein GIQ15_03795 [Arthroderma uncinatum]|uniref:uncharacterized protein n=1 Tax=Arthroderma uncinatum TaxID=74035 RepID=UPI00144A9ABF|nr:uncharacterized protein GIQ15_03795 [Arthroderma uncinatum]KAF3481036.1 hypothetical protein GIQ15_03795 [Arthroderma uncinatum]